MSEKEENATLKTCVIFTLNFIQLTCIYNSGFVGTSKKVFYIDKYKWLLIDCC